VEDYVPASGTLTMLPGSTNQTILVTIRGDAVYEGPEAFSLVLSSPANASLDDPVGLGAILDDDDAELTRYDIGTVPSPRYAGVPFPLTVTARDGLDRVVSTFAGAVRLSGFPDQAPVILGTDTREWKYPVNAFFHDSRLQVIYPASQLGQTGTISALTLAVQTPPGQVLNRWTVRMKHTPLTRFATPAWETNGWTTVYSRDLRVAGPGGALCFLDTPFEYNGTDNLMVDFSFDNASYSSDGACLCSATPETRSVYFESDSAFGDPLTWSAATAPPPLATNLVPNLRLLIGPGLNVTPSVLGPFVNGVWTGDVTVAEPVAAMRLRVADMTDRQTLSSVFAVEPDPDPAVSPTAVRITAVALEQANARIRFMSGSGHRYRVEWTDDPGAGRWFLVADQCPGTGAEVQIIDRGGGRQPRRFYRITVLP
jgi:hypothetical protein